MMTEHHKLSLSAAILININIMLGVGIFINTALLAQKAGALGFLSYAIVGVLLLPLIVCVAQLVKLHPSGGFYIFARRELNPFFGFLTAWVYFTGKLASSAVMIDTSVRIMQQLIPALASFNHLLIDMVILVLFVGLNTLNMKAGSRIQVVFMTLKASAIFFAISAGLFLFNGAHLTAEHLLWSGVPSTLPLVLYAAMGFEAACALSGRIQNAQRNAPLAIFISYAIVVTIIMLYQGMFYAALGADLAGFTSYREAFPALLATLFPAHPAFALKAGGLFNLAIASSALGGAYGILFSNNWNLYAIAQHQHIPYAARFAQFNKHAIASWCVFAEGILCAAYLLISQGNQVPLQQTAALAAALTYTLSVLAYMGAQRRNPTSIRWVSWLGLLSCSLLITSCITGLIQKGTDSLFLFGVLVAIGIVFYWITPGRGLPEPTEA